MMSNTLKAFCLQASKYKVDYQTKSLLPRYTDCLPAILLLAVGGFSVAPRRAKTRLQGFEYASPTPRTLLMILCSSIKTTAYRQDWARAWVGQLYGI